MTDEILQPPPFNDMLMAAKTALSMTTDADGVICTWVKIVDGKVHVMLTMAGSDAVETNTANALASSLAYALKKALQKFNSVGARNRLRFEIGARLAALIEEEPEIALPGGL